MTFSFEEITATVTGVLYVWLAVKEKPVCWIFGIVSSAAAILVALEAKYYMDIFINSYYILAGFYGLYLWTFGKSPGIGNFPISDLSVTHFGLFILAAGMFSLPLGYLFYRFTDNALPYLDAAVTSFAALATFMTAKKILQSWLLWIGVDFVWMLMYIYKSFYILSLLFAVYTAMSVLGYIQWKKQLSLQKNPLLRVAITGPESTGKTTLAKALAEHYGTVWVPEYARDYLTGLGRPYREEDLVTIAEGQVALEKSLEAKANRVLFCDTEMLVLKIWSEYRYDRCDPRILALLEAQQYDLYLLTDTDIPWEPDPLRENPDERAYFFRLYKIFLTSRRLSYEVLSGLFSERLAAALRLFQIL